MKKLTIILTIVFSGMLMQAQELTKEAKHVKNNDIEAYNKIKLFAEQDWKGNHEMMVYTINNQSKALIEVFAITKKSDYDSAIMFSAYVKWKEEINGITVVDNVMVLYTYKKQLKAKSAY